MVTRTRFGRQLEQRDESHFPSNPLDEWCLVILVSDSEQRVLPIINKLNENNLIKYCHTTLNEIDFDLVNKFWNWSYHLVVHDMFLDDLSKFIGKALNQKRKIIIAFLDDKYVYKSHEIITNHPEIGLLQFNVNDDKDYISRYMNTLLRGR